MLQSNNYNFSTMQNVISHLTLLYHLSETVISSTGNSYVTNRKQLCHTAYSYITLSCICYAYLLIWVREEFQIDMKNLRAIYSMLINIDFIQGSKNTSESSFSKYFKNTNQCHNFMILSEFQLVFDRRTYITVFIYSRQK